MSAWLTVDPADPTPPYEQVRRQIADLIEIGSLRVDDRLPPLRQLAGDLGLAVGTVARAYAELETSGHLSSRRGGGTRVADGWVTRPRRDLLAELAAAYVDRARTLGCADDAIERAVVARLRGPVGAEETWR